MKILPLHILFFCFVSFAGASLLKSPKISIETVSQSLSLEKHEGIWHYVSFSGNSKMIKSKKFSADEDVIALNSHFDNIRDWVLSHSSNVVVSPKCQDIKITLEGSVTRLLSLCSKLPAHRIFAQSLLSRIPPPSD